MLSDAALQERSIFPGEAIPGNDVQGAELMVLRGAPRAVASCGWLICEVSLRELYSGGASEAEIEGFAASCGLERRATIYHRYYDEQGWFVAWGEVLFERRAPEGGESS